LENATNQPRRLQNRFGTDQRIGSEELLPTFVSLTMKAAVLRLYYKAQNLLIVVLRWRVHGQRYRRR